MTPRLLTLPAESLDGYQACLKDVLELLDRVAPQPAIAHAPALRVVLEERAAMLPGLLELRRPAPTAALVKGPLTPEVEAYLRAWKASGPAPSPLPPDGAEWPWTPERDAALLEWSATTQDEALLLEVVNALPGPRLDSRAAIRTRLDWLRHQADEAAQRAEDAQEGLADAVAEATPAAPAEPKPRKPRRPHSLHPNSKRFAPIWTEERIAFAHANAAKMKTRPLWEALNRLPGLPIASTGSLRVKLRDLGLETDSAWPKVTASMTPEEATAAKAERARRAAIASGLGDWNEARLGLLRAEFATAELPALLDRINAIPGENPIASVESMCKRAKKMGLTRPHRGNGDSLRRYNQMRAEARATARVEPSPVIAAIAATPAAAPEPEVAPEPAAAPAPPPQPHSLKATTPWIAAAIAGKAPVAPVAAELDPWASTNPYRLTEEAEAEALAMLRMGQGAKALHEEFGGRLDWWQRWAGEKRQEGRAA